MSKHIYYLYVIQNDILLYEILICKEVSFNQFKKNFQQL